MNEFSVNLITFGTSWLQELFVDQLKHSKCIKINGKIQILYPTQSLLPFLYPDLLIQYYGKLQHTCVLLVSEPEHVQRRPDWIEYKVQFEL